MKSPLNKRSIWGNGTNIYRRASLHALHSTVPLAGFLGEAISVEYEVCRRRTQCGEGEGPLNLVSGS